MTDAQQLFDFARAQFNDIANDVERHFDLVASNLRDKFSRPLPAPPSRRLPPPTTYSQIERWISRHKALTAAIIAFAVTGSISTYIYIKSNESRKKRRARKSASGARTEVVVVAGAVANPLTAALYLDLERRGFIVYVVANTSEDEHFVRSQSRRDLIPLSLDLFDPFTAQQQILQFQSLLSRPHTAFENAEPHNLRLRALVIVPDTTSQVARIDDLSSEEWSDALNAKVLNTIANTRSFLSAVQEHKANVLLLTSSVRSSLILPMHAVESTVNGALQGFSASLSAELQQSHISFSHIKMGLIDIPAVTAKQRRDGVPAPILKSTPIRKLHDTIFDQVVATKPRRTLHVGRGSIAYDVIGTWMPSTFIAWMMNAGQRAQRKTEIGRDGSEDRMSGSAGSLTWEKIDDDQV